MAVVALYRKYRSQKFKEILGQDHVCQTLINSLKNSRISHAYLFTGPRGVGKTSVARILAKAVNCTSISEGEPCDKCVTCQAIIGGRALDLIEIDAASNRGIDEIRELREKIKFAPTEGKYKVFIIDEVHMLTKEAFNALLKTLEEPPIHAIFILATTEVHRVPTTVLSRCQRFDFRRIGLDDLINRLDYIAKNERIEIDSQALKTIAETSEGGFRDAISLLDQLASYGEKRVGIKEIRLVLGLSDLEAIENFIDCLNKNDIQGGISLINHLINDGYDLHQFTKSVIEILRKILLVKIAGSANLEMSEERIERIQKLAQSFSISRILQAIELFSAAEKEFKTSVFPQLFLEMSLVRLAMEGEEEPERLVKKEVEGIIKEEAEKEMEVKSQEKKEITKKKKVKVKTESKKKEKKKEKSPTKEPSKKILKGEKEPSEYWPEVIAEVKSKNNSISAFLKVAEPEFKDNAVVLNFPYKFHKERIEDHKNRKIVEAALDKIYKKKYIIKCILKEKSKEDKDSKKDEAEDDLLNTAKEIFGGKVVEE